ncbi:MAG: hypothetical protein Q7S06_01095 [Nanoarchaeota archaeon]|nr:hypothetical protein [Nanoarchaeota archaeon]
MRYQDKLTLTVFCGAIAGAVGDYMHVPILTSLGWTALGFGGFGLVLDNSEDEFADLRKEFHKREKLVRKSLECFQMH